MTGIRGRGYSSDAYPTFFQCLALALSRGDLAWPRLMLGLWAAQLSEELPHWPHGMDGGPVGLFPFLFLGLLPTYSWESPRLMVFVSGR